MITREMKKVKVVINEQHQMLEEQHQILMEKFSQGFEVIKVPSSGWTLEEIEEQVAQLLGETIVFISPIPAMIQKLSFMSGFAHEDNCIAHNANLRGSGTKVLTTIGRRKNCRMEKLYK